MGITPDGTKNAVQTMFVMLEQWHRLLHVRAFYAVNHQFIKYTMDLLSVPDVIERTTSRTSIWYKAGRQGILFGQPIEEKVQEEVLPGHP